MTHQQSPPQERKLLSQVRQCETTEPFLTVPNRTGHSPGSKREVSLFDRRLHDIGGHRLLTRLNSSVQCLPTDRQYLADVPL